MCVLVALYPGLRATSCLHVQNYLREKNNWFFFLFTCLAYFSFSFLFILPSLFIVRSPSLPTSSYIRLYIITNVSILKNLKAALRRALLSITSPSLYLLSNTGIGWRLPKQKA